MSKYKWKIFCITESVFVEGVITGESTPTVCFNDAGHTVNSNSPRRIKTFVETKQKNLEILKDPENTTETGSIILEGFLQVDDTSTPSTPSAGKNKIYFDSQKIKTINSSGTTINLLPLTTKGDLYTFDTNSSRLPVGTNGYILSANSSEATGLEWVENTGGGNDCKVKVSSNDTTADYLTNKLVVATRTGLSLSDLNDAGDEDLQMDLTNPIKAQDGSYTNPTYTFDSDPDTGMYRESSGDLAFAQNGICTLEIGTDNRVFMSNQVPNYETLVTTNQTFTNKKYVDDKVNTVTIDTLTPTTTKGDILVENGSNVVKLAVGTNGYVLTADSGEASGLKWSAASGGTNMCAIIRDEKSSGTNGGSFTTGGWRTRDLNTLTGNASSRVSLSSNQFTLQPGKYKIYASAPAIEVEFHVAKLRNVTDSTDIMGQTSYTKAGYGDQTASVVVAYQDISSAKVYEIQHRCADTESGDGFGEAHGYGTEVYTVVIIDVLQ